jgi:GR25 family glycosyltransferase involved in LPS biosynthesis
MTKTPILVMAFNRPRTLSALLSRIESLDKREVMISIDGPTIHGSKEQQLVLKSASVWKGSSKHEVEIVQRSSNFGIYDHLPIALQEFFDKQNYGLILEDDIEFVPGLIDFTDKNMHLIEEMSLWSICGHNPLNTSDPTARNNSKLSFRPSRFHSIWGWATSKENALRFVSQYPLEVDLKDAFEILSSTAKSLTSDPFLQRAFVLTWLRKISGWNERRERSGWDTRWVYEGWKVGKLSILPDISLSREVLEQSEGQTHEHISSGNVWQVPVETKFSFALFERSRTDEIGRLKTWGINRKYSWVFAKRIHRQLKEFEF